LRAPDAQAASASKQALASSGPADRPFSTLRSRGVRRIGGE
jgi:hypothetical protein